MGERTSILVKPRSGTLLITIAVVIVLMIPIGLQEVNAQPSLLDGAYRIDRDGWHYVHLEGTPYQVGYQHGYLLWDEIQDSWTDYIYCYFTSFEQGDYWFVARDIGRLYIWQKLTGEMQNEIQGIADGLKARGLIWDKWDVLAFNSWMDIYTYMWLYYEKAHKGVGGYVPLPRNCGCSAFIATGSYTSGGEIVIGHNTWSDYAAGHWNVLFDVVPKNGHEMVYQSTGGCIWSGEDWVYNDAGLMVCETTLPDMYFTNPSGIPVFVRVRYAMQYGDSIDDFINVMTYRNSGQYANEWLVGDAKTGEICSLQLGCYVWDIERTFDGFIGSCNYPKGQGVRSETFFDWTDTTNTCYLRYQRWNELKAYYANNPGLINCEVGMQMLSDHHDMRTGDDAPSENTLCGHYESDVNPPSDIWPWGAYDGKVTCSSMVLNDMGMWGRWGHPCGTPFIAAEFLAAHPDFSWMAPVLSDIPEGGVPMPWSYFTRSMSP